MAELHDLIERGPDWGALINIRITLARPVVEGMTLEEAEAAGQMTGSEWDCWVKARRAG